MKSPLKFNDHRCSSLYLFAPCLYLYSVPLSLKLRLFVSPTPSLQLHQSIRRHKSILLQKKVLRKFDILWCIHDHFSCSLKLEFLCENVTESLCHRLNHRLWCGGSLWICFVVFCSIQMKSIFGNSSFWFFFLLSSVCGAQLRTKMLDFQKEYIVSVMLKLSIYVSNAKRQFSRIEKKTAQTDYCVIQILRSQENKRFFHSKQIQSKATQMMRCTHLHSYSVGRAILWGNKHEYWMWSSSDLLGVYNRAWVCCSFFVCAQI